MNSTERVSSNRIGLLSRRRLGKFVGQRDTSELGFSLARMRRVRRIDQTFSLLA